MNSCFIRNTSAIASAALRMLASVLVGCGYSVSSHRGALASRGGSRSGAAAALSFVNRPGWREFQTVLGGLRRECPPALPIVVRASWLPETILGQCLRRDKRLVVMLNRDLGEPQAVEVLCHEWAHSLAWNFAVDRLINAPDTDPVEFERACHDEAWGCAYSRVWRAYLDVIRDAA